MNKAIKIDKIFSPIKQRIIEYLDYKGYKKDDFFQKTDIARSNFSGNGAKSEIGGDKLVKILTSYPDINPDWLLTGKGKMLRADSSELERENERLKAEIAELKKSAYSPQSLAERNRNEAEIFALREEIREWRRKEMLLVEANNNLSEMLNTNIDPHKSAVGILQEI